MRNTYTTIIVLIVVLIGAWLFTFSDNPEVEVPAPKDVVVGEGSGNHDGANMEEPTVEELNAEEDGTVVTVKEFTIEGQNFSLSPSVMTVSKGDTVKITFKNTGGSHNFVIDEFGVATNQANSPDTQTIEFVADKTGSFEYYCSVGTHRALGMVGTLVVESL